MAVAKRLSKVAKELGVGVNTIIAFLTDKGVEVDRGPNTKVNEEVYQILLEEYQSDKAAKEKSKQLSQNKEERKTISLEDQAKIDSQETSAEEEDDDVTDKVFIKSNITEVDKPQEEESPAPVKPEVKKVEEEAKEEIKEEEKEEEPKEKVEEKQEAVEAEEEDSKGPKIKGKIDIDKLNQKTRPSKKDKEKEEKEAAAKKEAEKKAAEEAEAKKKKEEEEEKERKKAEEEDSKEHKTEYVKLTGPKILDKIDIPEEKKKKDKKKPIASSSESKLKDRPKKRKRKRIGPDKGKSGGRKGKQQEAKELDEAEIQKEIKETLARLTGGGKSKGSKHRKAKREEAKEQMQKQLEQEEAEKKVLKTTEFVTVSDMASLMDVSANEVIAACMELGLFVSINQRLDAETLTLIADNFGYEVEFTTEEISEKDLVESDDEKRVTERPPIVTVMGHVDHGKTSLLDFIRKDNVIAGEAGGITQHIGAYNVSIDDDKTITFLDTPGHEAFTAMRARGAQVTDIVIIVIAADDSVMPQTKEAINHAQAAGVPIVFALNKVDKETANPDKIREELSQMNILLEDWGGKFQSQEISAKKGTGVNDLLEKVLIEAELLELKADGGKRANGTVIEATLDKGKGYVTTLLVQEGIMKVGDVLLAGPYSGRVKAMTNERGQRVKEAGPSMPVSVLGLSGAPNAGDKFHVLEDEREAREIANKREQLQREQGTRAQKHITLDEIGRRIAIGDFQELNVIIKGDVDGSIEALADSLLNLSTEKIQVNVISKAVGQISESDVLLASASDAVIIGFQVRPSAAARRLAEKEEIEIRLYSVIYKAIEELKDAMEGMLKPTVEEQVIGNIEIRETFKISKVGTIAGCYVTDGKVTRNSKVRLIRDGIVKYEGNLGSLKRFKDDVKEVKAGYECGLNIENFNDIKVGDQIEVYEEVEVKQSL